MEAGGHRGPFHAGDTERQMVALKALVRRIVGTVSLPGVATGGVADARGGATALSLGVSTIQIDTGYLRSPGVMTHPIYAARLGQT